MTPRKFNTAIFLFFTAGLLLLNAHANPTPLHRITSAQLGKDLPGPSGIQLLRRIVVGGEGSWGYLDFEPVTRRLFISRATKVVVLDVDSGKVVGDVLNTPGVHGVALGADLGRGFTSNSEANNVTIFDLETLKTILDVPAGIEPDTIVYDPSSKRTFAMNAHSQSITVIDAATGRAITSLTVR